MGVERLKKGGGRGRGIASKFGSERECGHKESYQDTLRGRVVDIDRCGQILEGRQGGGCAGGTGTVLVKMSGRQGYYRNKTYILRWGHAPRSGMLGGSVGDSGGGRVIIRGEIAAAAWREAKESARNLGVW
eukprot:764091-Hanusia_phi.AAC.15